MNQIPEYKSKESVSTGIHTRITDTIRISSAWRTYSNINFKSQAWETFTWDGDKIIAEYNVLRTADAVVDLHQEILNRYNENGCVVEGIE